MFLGVDAASNKVNTNALFLRKIIKMHLGLSHGKTEINLIVLVPRHGLQNTMFLMKG